MIFTTLQPTAEDIQRSEKYKTEFIITPIARTPVVFFVNSDNPINNISEKEIQEIYSGEISRWSQLGGKSIRHIKAYQSYYDDICQMELKILMGDIPLIEPIQIRKLCVCGYYHMNIADYTNYKNAIGFSLRLYTTEMVDNNEIKLLSVNGVYPSNENVINNTYPLCVTIYAVITQDSNPKCNDILDWIQSEQGQCLIKKSGFVGIGDKVN
jgi:phosphate transport system substrate-binding protein